MNWLKRLWTSHSWWFSRTRMAYHVAPSKSELWSTWIWTLMATTSLSPLLKLFTIAAGTCGSFKILPNACWGHLEVFVFVQHIQYIINAHPNCFDPFWEKIHLDIWMDCSRIHWLRLWIHDAFPRTFMGALSKYLHVVIYWTPKGIVKGFGRAIGHQNKTRRLKFRNSLTKKLVDHNGRTVCVDLCVHLLSLTSARPLLCTDLFKWSQLPLSGETRSIGSHFELETLEGKSTGNHGFSRQI